MGRNRVPKLVVGLLVAVSAVSLGVSPLHAEEEPLDEVTVKGQTLQGRVVGFDRESLRFTTIYGQGTLEISYDDIENLKTERAFWLMDVDDEVVRGRLLAVEGNDLLVGEKPSSAKRVPMARIRSGIAIARYDESLLTRLRSRYRYWDANLDLVFAFEEGAIDKRKIEAGIHVERRRKPTRVVFDFRYSFETQEKLDQPKITTKDESRTLLLGEYDLRRHLNIFLFPAVEWDAPRQIDFRAFPAAGFGYRFGLEQTAYLLIRLGAGYVTEQFNGFPDNDYTAAYFGGEGRYKWDSGVDLYGILLYMPNLANADDNWLFRSELNLLVPIYDPLALKWRLVNVNDDNPSEAVGSNKVETSLGFAFTF